LDLDSRFVMKPKDTGEFVELPIWSFALYISLFNCYVSGLSGNRSGRVGLSHFQICLSVQIRSFDKANAFRLTKTNVKIKTTVKTMNRLVM